MKFDIVEMNLKNETKNQHFLPQVEQRLNAFNPNAGITNQKVYSFDLIDRESCEIKLENSNGFKISNSLSLHDLFSFDVVDKNKFRYNFEDLFQQYEENIELNTKSLLDKLPNTNSDIKKEILEIFVSKFLNFVRNPYSIKKVINSFPSLLNYHPTDPEAYKYFNQVLNGRKPHQEYLCKKLAITDEEYKKWLTIIFMLLYRFNHGEPNFMEDMVRRLYMNPKSFVKVLIYKYDNHTCLLSDRGYSIPVPDEELMAFDFNLYSNAFIRYAFADIEKLAPKNAPKRIIELYKSMPKTVDVHCIVNDLEVLSKYNTNTVYQCFNNVYNSSTECYGLTNKDRLRPAAILSRC